MMKIREAFLSMVVEPQLFLTDFCSAKFVPRRRTLFNISIFKRM